jgi:hypothetical protein
VSQDQTVAARIIEVVTRSPGCLLEELTLACPNVTWNQVFIEVARLSRDGTLRLERKDPGIYSIHLPANV